MTHFLSEPGPEQSSQGSITFSPHPNINITIGRLTLHMQCSRLTVHAPASGFAYANSISAWAWEGEGEPVPDEVINFFQWANREVR
jgi:hypothetical protein